MPAALRRYPVRVRPLHLETAESFAQRLVVAQGLPESVVRTECRRLLENDRSLDTEMALWQWCEARGGLKDWYFAERFELFYRSSPELPLKGRGMSNDGGLPDRFACRKCAMGERVSLIDHADYNCCLHHGLWTGPGVEPRDQCEVSDEVRRAEVLFRRLRVAGRASMWLLSRLADLISREQGRPPVLRILNEQNYRAVVSLAQLVTDRSLHRRLLTPTLTFAQARWVLSTEVAHRLPGASAVFIDGLWKLLRPAFQAVRDALLGQAIVPSQYCDMICLDPDDVCAGARAWRPLEPFSRYLVQTQCCLTDQKQEHDELFQVPFGSRVDDRVLLLCPHGHWHSRDTQAEASDCSVEHTSCPYCSGRRALPGFNSMAETHPLLASQWDFDGNGAVTPSDVSGAGNGNSYWWVCPLGHRYSAAPNNRSKGQACPYCAGRRALPGFNTLDVTHPELALQWNRERNLFFSPEMVTAGMRQVIYWTCPLGHDYQARLDVKSSSRGFDCPVCRNRIAVAGVNDLATTHPEIAAQWHPHLNANTTPHEIVASTSQDYYWQCEHGHTFTAAVITRVKGQGCPYCAGKCVWPGFNDLATTHPQVAEQWDAEANWPWTNHQVTAGSRFEAAWKCAWGHRYRRRVSERVKGLGCPYCAHKKLLPGFNDFATERPDIAADWHPTKNGHQRPETMLAGNKEWWWQCPQGHEEYGTVPNRIKTNGCVSCRREARARSRRVDRSLGELNRLLQTRNERPH
ncbi:zinc-ribbon domain-containing protein [Arthrobacter sp. RAF14]|uniref:zinc-ribbon domain-containing protein n=1 Tax=Arthrobacter sp. RAF14 TaxID=3233051 RepID=UPI003F8FE1A9